MASDLAGRSKSWTSGSTVMPGDEGRTFAAALLHGV